jgi:hypothetical protein
MQCPETVPKGLELESTADILWKKIVYYFDSTK